MGFLISQKLIVFLPSGYEQPDIRMSIGTVEKLFEPQASFFPPGGPHEPILTLFKQPKHSALSNRARFSERSFCSLLSSNKSESQSERSAAKRF